LHAAGEYRPEMLNDEPLLGVVNETNRILIQALDAGVADNIPSPAMLKKLREDVFVFSGFKTHAQLKEASSYLLTDDGKIKPFQDFRRDVWAVHTSYNSHYLEAEYIFATSAAEMASRWSDYEKDGDRYNLQYRTAGDNRVRDEHAAINLTTLPVDDPFWGSYFPPNGWRCRCVAVQVRKGKYEESNPEEAMAKGEKATTRINKKGENADAIFRFNPGKDKVIFPPHHPYRKVQDRVLKIINSLPGKVGEVASGVYDLPYAKQFEVKHEYASGGKVEFHKALDLHAEDHQDKLNVANAYAKTGGNVKMMPEIDSKATEIRKVVFKGLEAERSNPDFFFDDAFYADLKRPQAIKNITGNANNAFKQGAVAVISDNAMIKPLTKEIMDKRAKAVFSDKNREFYKYDSMYFYSNGKLYKYNRQ
jgi:SPP1 gp7 family putative phage head morphogenesis protein